MQRAIIIFLGPPGAGKGSLSQLCVDRLKYQQVSTGNLCRWRAADGSEEGRQIAFFISSGKLISDGLMIGAVSSWLVDHENSFTTLILDGFPRTVAQARALDQMLRTDERLSRFVVQIVVLDVDDAIVEQRLTSRRICSNSVCGATYSTIEPALMPAVEGVCDRCNASLIVRSDDTVEAVKKRLAAYHEHARGIIQYYEQTGRTPVRIDVNRSLEEVFDQLVHGLQVDLKEIGAK